MSSPSQQLRLCAGCLAPGGDSKCAQCGWHDNENPASNTHLPRHYVLVGRYYIGRVLGQGGFGVTYLAQDTKLRRPVAVKEYLPSEQCTRLTDRVTLQPYSGEKQHLYKTGLERFLDEAQALAKFSTHPGVVTITDFAEANGTAYLVMNYERGYSLKDHLQAKGGRLPYQLTLKLMMPAMDALREVHKHGLLHRDVSPDNIFLTQEGQVKLMDFGAARYAIGEQSQALSMILKPGFAPEEQYRTKGRQGAWTDVYAVSATMYRCITGTMPPAAPDRMAGEELVRPSTLCPDLPREAEAALMMGMAVKSENRFQTIEALQNALANSGLGAVAPPPPPPPPPMGAGHPFSVAAPQAPPPPPVYEVPRADGSKIIGRVALVLAIVSGLWAILDGLQFLENISFLMRSGRGLISESLEVLGDAAVSGFLLAIYLRAKGGNATALRTMATVALVAVALLTIVKFFLYGRVTSLNSEFLVVSFLFGIRATPRGFRIGAWVSVATCLIHIVAFRWTHIPSGYLLPFALTFAVMIWFFIALAKYGPGNLLSEPQAVKR